MSGRFIEKHQVSKWFKDKSVAIVGSGPGVLDNDVGYIDKNYDIVVRVNNYKIFPKTGRRVDVHYSFYGNSIKKTQLELKRDRVKLCMCKCPDSHPIHSQWHIDNDKMFGVDFRWIYVKRRGFWFTDTYIPSDEDFLKTFNLLDRHIPSTGFSAIHDIMQFEPSEIYLTGFDFFQSGIHNVNAEWKHKNLGDPICHRPDLEIKWVAWNRRRFKFDKMLSEIIEKRVSEDCL